MNDKKKGLFANHKPMAVVITVGLCILAAGWLILIIYAKSKSGTLKTYTFSEENSAKSQDGLSVSFEISKKWMDPTYHYDNQYGAEYDATISNQSDYLFKDWKIEIVTEGEPELDSAWNGEYEIEGNHIIFTAGTEGETKNVSAGEKRTFGAVLYTQKDYLKLVNYTISGYWDVDITQTGWFWILVELSSLFVFFVIVCFLSVFRAARYEQQRQHDYEIIEQSMKTLTGIIDAKDAYTKDHSVRVAHYAKEIGIRMGLKKEEADNLYFITLMHDCGKVGIKDEILNKPGVLTPEEFAIAKKHTTIGNEILAKFTTLEGIRDGAHYHHERYDGYGYPDGLEGEDIPLCARIICIADAYDAMSSDRCYRKALDRDKILEELNNNSGRQFDPAIVPLMIGMIKDGFVDKIKEKYPTK